MLHFKLAFLKGFVTNPVKCQLLHSTVHSYKGSDMPTCKMGPFWCTGAVLTGCPSGCHQ